MNRKSLIITLVGYTLFMFLAGNYFINPGKSVGYNIIFAIACGVLYGTFMWFYYRYMARKKGPTK